MKKLELIPIHCPRRFGKFNLKKVLIESMERGGIKLRSGDLLIVSSKFAAISEGRFVKLSGVSPSTRAIRLRRMYGIDAPTAQLVLNESDSVLGGAQGFVLALIDGVMAPNAGIDKSNVPGEYAVLYPKDPYTTALKLRKALTGYMMRGRRTKPKIGVVLSDSRVAPARLGTIGVALAVSGFNPVVDLRGSKDLFGNMLKFTIRALADQISSAAQLLMGEASESIPAAILRGIAVEFVDDSSEGDLRNSPLQEERSPMAISTDRCLIIQGLRNPFVQE